MICFNFTLQSYGEFVKQSLNKLLKGVYKLLMGIMLLP